MTTSNHSFGCSWNFGSSQKKNVLTWTALDICRAFSFWNGLHMEQIVSLLSIYLDERLIAMFAVSFQVDFDQHMPP